MREKVKNCDSVMFEEYNRDWSNSWSENEGYLISIICCNCFPTTASMILYCWEGSGWVVVIFLFLIVDLVWMIMKAQCACYVQEHGIILLLCISFTFSIASPKYNFPFLSFLLSPFPPPFSSCSLSLIFCLCLLFAPFPSSLYFLRLRSSVCLSLPFALSI